jgi:hypothetical protein
MNSSEGKQMTQIVLLDLFTCVSGGEDYWRPGTPVEIGESIFQDLLRKNTESKSDSADSQDCSSLRRLEEKISEFGYLGNGLTLPPGESPRLAEVLEEAGLTQEETDRVIREASDGEGFVHLDRLFRGLRKMGSLNSPGDGNHIIPFEQASQASEILFRLGLGAGAVKTLRENATNEDADLVLERLVTGLGKFFPGRNLAEEIASIFYHSGIRGQAKEIGEGMGDPKLQDLLRKFAQASDQNQQQKIREEIAGLLGEKGVSPGRAKEFLEKLSIPRARGLLASNSNINGEMAEETEEILNQVRRRPSRNWKDIDIPANAHSLGTRGPLKNETSGQSVFEKLGQFGETGGDDALDYLAKVKMARLSVKERFEEGSHLSQQDNHGVRSLKGFFGLLLENQQGEFGKAGRVVQTGATSAMRTPQPLQDTLPRMLDRMIWMIHAGQQKSRIQLSPPELGRLDIRLMIEHGHLRAHMNAESVWAKEMIDSNLNQLKQQLSDLGFVVDQFDVMAGLDQRSGSDDEMWETKEGIRPTLRGREGRAEDLPREGDPDGRKIAGHYQINVRV